MASVGIYIGAMVVGYYGSSVVKSVFDWYMISLEHRRQRELLERIQEELERANVVMTKFSDVVDTMSMLITPKISPSPLTIEECLD